MRLLAAPAWLAGVATLLGLALHPRLGLDRWAWARPLAPALALLLVIALLSRAWRCGLAWRLLALGAACTLAALGVDALRGHTGSLTLLTGGAANRFEEEGPGGRSLGLRPLGFGVRLDAVDAAGGATLTAGRDDSREVRLSVGPTRAAGFAGVRLGEPVPTATGAATSLKLAVAGKTGTQQLTIAPGQTARVGDAEIALEDYFADFALDERKNPFSRGPEPHNPAALLNVRRGSQAFRVFVIRALPGVHRQEGLDLSFSLVDVEPERALRLRVSQLPAAALVAAGLAAALAGLALARGAE